MSLDAIRWQQISEAFGVVRALPPPARAEALASFPGLDTAQRHEVAQLLAADVDDTFLDGPPLALTRAMQEHSPPPTTRFGAYVVEREIGRGGMGVVYAGRHVDPSLDRMVAIKTLPVGPQHPEVAWRFRRERELLARLSHPHIARLYDGGTTPDGTPYLVMEYVDGQRIDAWCDEQALSVTARLDLFQQVCAAVQHAHAQLVVHRDLKPTNVLVTRDGEVKLLDFGIAKLVDPTTQAEITRGPASPMTPAYASPEQRRGETVTIASDIYSLGVLLHRLLTGVVPAPGAPDPAATGAMRAVVATSLTAEHASRCGGLTVAGLRARLRGDLEAIMQMALRAEPSRRYASADALRVDIQRHLKGLPVSAKPDTLRYRVATFVRRQRALSVAVAVAVLATVTGIVTSTRAARRAQAEAEQLRRVNSMLQQLINAGASERYTSVPTLLGVLDSARATVAREFADAPRTRAELYAQFAASYYSFDHPELALLVLDSARVLYSRTDGPASLPAAYMLAGSVNALTTLGRADSAFARQQQAVMLLRALQPASTPALNEAEVDLAFNELALRNAVDSGLTHMAAALARERHDTAPRWDMIARGEAVTIMPLFYRSGPAAAESAYVRSTAALRRHSGPSQDQRTALAFQAQSLLLRGRAADAVPVARALLAATEQRLGPSHYLTAQAQNLLARTLIATQEFTESRILIDSAIANNEAAPVRDPLYLGEMYLTRAGIAVARRDWTAARTSLQRAAMQRDRMGAQRPMLEVSIRTATAGVYEAQGRLAEARATLDAAVQLADSALAPGTRNRGLAEAARLAFVRRHPTVLTAQH